LPEHLVPADRPIESEHLVDGAQRLPQMAHLRGGDRQRCRSGRGDRGGAQAQLELALPTGQPLSRRDLERLQLLIVVRRPQVLDPPRASP